MYNITIDKKWYLYNDKILLLNNNNKLLNF